MAANRYERPGGIGGEAVAYEIGRQAYRQKKPVWVNPAIGNEADAWRQGYLAEQAANGGAIYEVLPRRRRAATVLMKSPRGGGRRTARALHRLA